MVDNLDLVPLFEVFGHDGHGVFRSPQGVNRQLVVNADFHDAVVMRELILRLWMRPTARLKADLPGQPPSCLPAVRGVVGNHRQPDAVPPRWDCQRTR